MSVVPQVSLSLETYRWDPRVRVKTEKEKGRKGEVYWAGSESGGPTRLGSGSWIGLGVGLQAGSACGSSRRPASRGGLGR